MAQKKLRALPSGRQMDRMGLPKAKKGAKGLVKLSKQSTTRKPRR